MEITHHVHWGFRIQCPLLRIWLCRAKERKVGENNRLQKARADPSQSWTRLMVSKSALWPLSCCKTISLCIIMYGVRSMGSYCRAIGNDDDRCCWFEKSCLKFTKLLAAAIMAPDIRKTAELIASGTPALMKTFRCWSQWWLTLVTSKICPKRPEMIPNGRSHQSRRTLAGK